MKKKNVITVVAISAAVAATLYLLQRKKRNRRKAFVANAGYETAYDVQYPVRYSRSKSAKN